MHNLLSFTSYDKLMSKIHDIPYGIKNDTWNITEIEVEQETIGLPPSTYQIRYWNIISVLESSAIWEQAKNCVVSNSLVSLVSLANP